MGLPCGLRASHSGCCSTTYDEAPSAKSKNQACTAIFRCVALADQDGGKVELAVPGHDGRREALARPEEPGRGLHLHHQRVDVRARQLLDEGLDRRLGGPGVARASPTPRGPAARARPRRSRACSPSRATSRRPAAVRRSRPRAADSDPFSPQRREAFEPPARSCRGQEEEDVAGSRGRLATNARARSSPCTNRTLSSASPSRGTGAQHGDAQHSLDRPARPRVHDVRVRDAVLLEGARVAARDAERAVTQRHAVGLAAGSRRVLDVDLPRLGSRWRAQPVDAAAAEVDERRADASAPQLVDRAVDGVALADAAEVELDAGAVEANRAVLGGRGRRGGVPRRRARPGSPARPAAVPRRERSPTPS